jgi:hypothetical protein
MVSMDLQLVLGGLDAWWFETRGSSICADLKNHRVLLVVTTLVLYAKVQPHVGILTEHSGHHFRLTTWYLLRQGKQFQTRSPIM